MDRRLLEMEISGETYRVLSREFGYHVDALRRHKQSHLGQDVQDIKAIMDRARIEAIDEAEAREREAVKGDIEARAKDSTAARLEVAKDHFDQLREIRDHAADLLDRAEGSDDLKTAAVFLRELRELVRLWAELDGKISAAPQITLITSPEWVEVRSLVINALEPYPEAREAVVHAIRGR